MKRNSAGNTRKSHKSRKTGAPEPGKPETSVVAPGVGPSVEASVTALAPLLPDAGDHKDIGSILAAPTEADKAEESQRSTGIPTENPKDQWWYREPDSKTRKLVAKIVVMLEAGRSYKDIAKKLKTTEGTLRQAMYIGRKNRWLDVDDEPVDVEAELALNIDRKIVRNISSSLDGNMTNWQTHEMTIAAAKGRGHFKAHESVKVDTNAQMGVVAIQVVMPTVGVADQKVDEQSVGGTPAYVEGDVADDQALLPAVRETESGVRAGDADNV